MLVLVKYVPGIDGLGKPRSLASTMLFPTPEEETIAELYMSIIILADSFILRRPGLQVRAPKRVLLLLHLHSG
jgi:hypothetical protein